jgi:hypothetical protein
MTEYCADDFREEDRIYLTPEEITEKLKEFKQPLDGEVDYAYRFKNRGGTVIVMKPRVPWDEEEFLRAVSATCPGWRASRKT